jgi:hypothetical protein
VDRDDRSIAQPAVWRESEIYAIFYNSWIRHLSVEHHAAAAIDSGALNVNAWDEVPDSSWFVNRIGRNPMEFEQIAQTLEGRRPAEGRWKIRRNNNEGYTPKFDIEDAEGRRYVLKFDPPGGLERNSAAERICTLIMHAAGYNVPHNTIEYFTPDRLYLEEDSLFIDPLGARRPLNAADVEKTLRELPKLADGRYRAVASLVIPGIAAVGRFFYAGLRKDDPNDIIPHELRRELRGLKAIASWINHVDAGDKNALDMYVEQNGRKFVKHYLLDFGSAMGSGNFVNGPFRVGHEFIFDGSAIGRSFLTLGGWRRPWETSGRIGFPEIGYFQHEVFDPEKWKPNYPNLAFNRADDSDEYWGAKIVTAFSDAVIDKLAEAGEYTRPEVTRRLAEVLKARRNRIGEYWFDRVTPVEDVELKSGAGKSELTFRDIGVAKGYATASRRQYRYWVEDLQGKRLTPVLISGGVGGVDVSNMPGVVSSSRGNSRDQYGRMPSVRVLIQSNRRVNGWAMPVEVYLGATIQRNEPHVLGWFHAPK